MAINTEMFDFLLPEIKHSLKEPIAHAYKALTHAQGATLANSAAYMMRLAKTLPKQSDKEHVIHAIEKCEHHLDEVNQAFADELAKAFQLFAGKHGEQQSLSIAEDLSGHENLAAEDIAESRIFIQGIIATAQRQNEKDLAQITHVLQNSLPTAGISESNNPLNPSVIGMALFNAIQKANIHIHAQQHYFKLYQEQVFDKLKPFYQSVIKKMQQNDLDVTVAPSLSAINPNDGMLSEHSTFKLDTIESEDIDIDGLDNTDIASQTSSSTLSYNLGHSMADIENDILHLIHDVDIPANLNNTQYKSLEEQIRLTDKDNMRIVDSHVIDELIASLQKNYQHSSDDDISAFIRNELRVSSSNDERLVISRKDENIIHIIGLCLKQIANKQQSSIGKLLLQLKPIFCRLALSDELFFHDSSNSAIKLLDHLLLLINQTALDERAFRTVKNTIENLQSKFNGSNDIFNEALETIQHALAEETKNQERNNEELNALFESDENHRLAELAAKHYLENHFKAINQPLKFYQLLELIWANILADISLSEGQDSNAWHEALETLSDILAIQQTEDDQTLKGLLKNLPSTAKQLNQLLANHDIEPDIKQVFLEQLQEIQLLRLRGKSLDEITDDSLSYSESVEQCIDELLIANQQGDSDISIGHEHLSFPNGASYMLSVKANCQDAEQALALVKKLSIGQWLDIVIEGKETAAQIGFFSQATQRYVFFDRDHHQLFERKQSDLAKDIELGFANLLNITISFEASLASISKKLQKLN